MSVFNVLAFGFIIAAFAVPAFLVVGGLAFFAVAPMLPAAAASSAYITGAASLGSGLGIGYLWLRDFQVW